MVSSSNCPRTANLFHTGNRTAGDSGLLLSQLSAAAQRRTFWVGVCPGDSRQLGGRTCHECRAYGGELSQVVRRVYLLNEQGERLEWSAEQAGLWLSP
jgi:UDP-N-acetylenolpyruvoylglucosamine reductase